MFVENNFSVAEGRRSQKTPVKMAKLQMAYEIGLVNTEAPHAKVPRGLAQMPGQVFLPGFPVVDLVTLRKAIAIAVDPARFALVHE